MRCDVGVGMNSEGWRRRGEIAARAPGTRPDAASSALPRRIMLAAEREPVLLCLQRESSRSESLEPDAPASSACASLIHVHARQR
jgi:hypothetical protein